MPIKDDLLAREADHRIANSLQLVAGLLLAQARGNRDPDSAGELMAASRRISSVSRVHQQLHQGGGGGLLALGPYLEILCKDIADGVAGSDPVRLASDDLLVDAGRAVDIGLVVTELVLNALKHAGGGTIDVRGRVVDHSFLLTISDCGPGLPADFQDQVPRSGLGLKLVRRLAEDLGTELTSLPEGRGATFLLAIPLVRLRRPATFG